jgi:hypothetical protein
VLFHQDGLEAAHGGVAGDRGAGNSAPDHQQVDRLSDELGQSGTA